MISVLGEIFKISTTALPQFLKKMQNYEVLPEQVLQIVNEHFMLDVR